MTTQKLLLYIISAVIAISLAASLVISAISTPQAPVNDFAIPTIDEETLLDDSTEGTSEALEATAEGTDEAEAEGTDEAPETAEGTSETLEAPDGTTEASEVDSTAEPEVTDEATLEPEMSVEPTSEVE